jgi:hypothetical protein
MSVRALVSGIESGGRRGAGEYGVDGAPRPMRRGLRGRRQDRVARAAGAARLFLSRAGLERGHGSGAVRAHQSLRTVGDAVDPAAPIWRRAHGRGVRERLLAALARASTGSASAGRTPGSRLSRACASPCAARRSTARARSGCSPTPHRSLIASSAWQLPMMPTSGAMTPFSAQLSALVAAVRDRGSGSTVLRRSRGSNTADLALPADRSAGDERLAGAQQASLMA